MPLLQLFIMRYKDDPPVVLLGWGFDGGRSINIYQSKGKETVDYLVDYF